MLPDCSVRWHAVADASLTWREWDGEIVVFNEETGSTHLLNELAGEVLRLLVTSERGTTIGALAAGFAGDATSADVPVRLEAIAEALSEFARVGLARPESP